jgi:aminopeptidase N
MAVFDRIRLEASKEDYPVLLANGNLVEDGDSEEEGRHFATWTDPYPKPSYLFCCVAGKLGMITDSYTTVPSGREVELNIYSDPNDAHKLQYAMESLKNSMKWDEDTFGLEYDLDLYNIVAVDSFNMGAMENKGLNVFNTAYVLADPSTATDTDYERVEGVIGHEYFHNWTGNRVTCRDWFQLTLKEGLTVFRDQEFSGDMNSKAVKRIESVVSLRAAQFAQDAGPMSHPIRPDSYISMDNFYTATVYNKGAEIIRMYHTLLGKDGFRKGMDLYFERHDGGAVTCDDFLAAMSDATGVELEQFSRWYSTPGTPVVTHEHSYDAEAKQWSLTLSQTSNSDEPLHIPISIGLLDAESGAEVLPTTVLDLKEATQTFVFDSIEGPVVPSLLRQFSAPIKLFPSDGKTENETDLAFLAARDTDGFNKWESGQALLKSLVFQVMDGTSLEDTKTWGYVKEAFQRTLTDYDSEDYSILAYALTLPSEGTLIELVDEGSVDPLAIHKSRGMLKKALANEFGTYLKKRYESLTEAMAGSDFKVDAESIGSRRLRNVCLDYLCSLRSNPEEEASAAELAKAHYESATGMTDKVAALSCLASMHGAAGAIRDEMIQRFYDEADGDALVLDKWFMIQAMADLPDILDRIEKLKQHPDFSLVNPNRCRSLVGGFCANAAGFHDESGKGYAFVRGILEELDPLNPQISGRLSSSLITWKKYKPERSEKMKQELQTLSELKPISDDLFEIVSRGLKD